MAVIAEPTFVGAQFNSADNATGVTLTVPGSGSASFWLVVAGTNQSFFSKTGWTTVHFNAGTYGKLYVAWTTSDPGSSITFGGVNTGTYSATMLAFNNVDSSDPFLYESLYNSTAYGTTHQHPGYVPTDTGYVAAVGGMQEIYARTVNTYGILSMTMWGTNVKNVSPSGYKFTSHYAVKGQLDGARTHTYRTSYTSNSRGVMWWGLLKYGISGPSFTRDGVAGANIGTVDSVAASSIGAVDGVS